jgi:hypothetical protein
MLIEIPGFSPAEPGRACTRDVPDANGRAAYYSRKRDMEYGRGAGSSRVKDRRLHTANSGHDWLVGTCRGSFFWSSVAAMQDGPSAPSCLLPNTPTVTTQTTCPCYRGVHAANSSFLSPMRY